MSLKEYLFKPKWKHKDPEVRAEAVATGSEAELLAALPTIGLEDESPAVRMAALRRITDLPLLGKAAGKASDKQEQTLIADRIRGLATSAASTRPPLEQRLVVIAATGDRALLENAALHAPEAELRHAAIERVERQGVLGDAAIGDPDPANRRQAAGRITQHSTLQRVIEGLRKSDKALHQDLQARLHGEMLAAGDRRAVQQEARALCEALEALALAPGEVDDAALAALQARWDEFCVHATPELQQRHEALLARLRPAPEIEVKPASARVPAEPRPETAPGPKSEPGPELQPELQPETGPVSGPAAGTEAAEDPGRTGKTDQAASGEAVKPVSDKTGQRDELVAKLEGQVALLLEQVEAGELHHALVTRSEILAAGKALGRDRRWQHLKGQLGQVQGQLREMRDWLHWSNNKIRKRLITEMHALPGSGLHPDAVLEKLKELQAQWKELEQSEQIPGEKHFSAPPWMWRKFNAAGRAAFDLTKPFLDKRTEVQQQLVDKVNALRRELDELSAAETPDWEALRKAVSSAGRSLRDMSGVPARSRKKVAGRLRRSMETANARLREYYQEVEKTKRKLIRAAAQLTHVEDRDEAIATAKSLQAEWKSAGRLWRSLDQKLWKEFRAPIEPLFEQLKTEHEAETEARKEELGAQKQLCADLQELLQLDDAELAVHRGKVAGMQDAWQDIPRPSAGLRKKFQHLRGEYDQRLRRNERRLAEAEWQRWWLKAELLHKLEIAAAASKTAPKKAQKDWPAEAPDDNDMDQALDERRDRAVAGDGDAAPAGSDETVAAAHLLCIRLEFLAGLPSPDDDKDLRMNYQVERLSASMSGEAERLPAREEARQAEREWLLMPLLPAAQYKAFRTRIRAALDEVFKE